MKSDDKVRAGLNMHVPNSPVLLGSAIKFS